MDKTKLLPATLAAAMLAVAGLAGCSGASNTNTTNSNASSTPPIANTVNDNDNNTVADDNTNEVEDNTNADDEGNLEDEVNANGNTGSTVSNANTSGMVANTDAQDNSNASGATEAEEQITGKIVDTTFKDRASEVGYDSPDFADNTDMLTLLVLNKPVTVTAYKGGGDYTGEVSVIRLPNDEKYRRFAGKPVTVTVTKWGDFPSDISGMLYDLSFLGDDSGLEVSEG